MSTTTDAARRWLIKPSLYLVGVAVTALATIVLVYAVQARVRLPELHAWHKIVLREEAGRAHPAAFESFEAYRQQEERLFAELRERIYAEQEADTVQVWPHLVVIEFLGAVIITINILLLSTLFNAPLLGIANPV